MKIELVFIPSPGIGHLRSTVELAKQIVTTDNRLSITVIIIPHASGGDVGGNNISSLFTTTTSHGDRLRYVTISVADQTTADRQPTQIYIGNQKPQVRDAVSKLADPKTRRLAGFVIDMFCISMMDLADEFGVRSYMFYTSNAAFLGITLHLQLMYDEKNDEMMSELDLGDDSVDELVFPCLTRPYPVKCLPRVFLSKQWLPFYLAQARKFRELKGILVNTVAELEPHALKLFSDDLLVEPRIFTIRQTDQFLI
ncbi:unnamed protein product [Microthlaspi erraticum]|uniref:Uncharacterized protein n=1 Tax=Microthlaspi erraticum TaxID=1685480 RepID=A0A6D2HLA3_9BRAS|nr:unnamed protein product [Microthlaspi erraticum]